MDWTGRLWEKNSACFNCAALCGQKKFVVAALKHCKVKKIFQKFLRNNYEF